MGLPRPFLYLRVAGGLDQGLCVIIALCLQVFMHENALNPTLFPSLRKFETEVVSAPGSRY
jgi:hypothetical protein